MDQGPAQVRQEREGAEEKAKFKEQQRSSKKEARGPTARNSEERAAKSGKKDSGRHGCRKSCSSKQRRKELSGLKRWMLKKGSQWRTGKAITSERTVGMSLLNRSRHRKGKDERAGMALTRERKPKAAFCSQRSWMQERNGEQQAARPYAG